MKNIFIIKCMDNGIEAIRRENLLLLLRDFVRREKVFAEKIGVEPSYLSRIKAGLPITNGTARRIETAFNKPSGWMDISTVARSEQAAYEIGQPPTAPEPYLSEEERILLENFRALCPDQKAALKTLSNALAQSAPNKKTG